MTMYFNECKERPLGKVLTGGKLLKKLHKSLGQLKRYDPDVIVSTVPTKILFVSNSSVLCGVSIEELEEIFHPFDVGCDFVVFPNKRAYSFVEFTSIENAIEAKEKLNGKVPEQLVTSHLPFVIEYVENVPLSKCTAGESGPKDLRVVDEFISEEDEKTLGSFLESCDGLIPMKYRTVMHFGYSFDYSTNSAFTPTTEIPSVLNEIIQRLLDEGYVKESPDQVTVNIYEGGQGIPSHFDTHSAFEDPIISVSLSSDVIMEFKDAANSARICPVMLRRRSLCVMQGDARYRWKHGIVNRHYDVDPTTNRVVGRKKRISITFRKIRRKPCECPYKEFCDWNRNGEMEIPSSEGRAKILEDEYVADVYEKIADHFDETRHSIWSAVKRFLDSIPAGSVLYDVGCGNGKYLVAKDNLIKIGCDMCAGLCSIASKKNCHVVRGDALAIPFRTGADAVISIAVLHHMSTWERRKQMMEQLLSMLRPGGRLCVTVWSMDQTDSQYSKMRENKEKMEETSTNILLVHDGKEFVQQDLLVPWNDTKNNQTFLRFYHIFEEGEMEKLVGEIAGCQLESIEQEQGNWIAVLSKL